MGDRSAAFAGFLPLPVRRLARAQRELERYLPVCVALVGTELDRVAGVNELLLIFGREDVVDPRPVARRVAQVDVAARVPAKRKVLVGDPYQRLVNADGGRAGAPEE